MRSVMRLTIIRFICGSDAISRRELAGTRTNVEGCTATTLAVRGIPVRAAISPKKSPRLSVSSYYKNYPFENQWNDHLSAMLKNARIEATGNIKA